MYLVTFYSSPQFIHILKIIVAYLSTLENEIKPKVFLVSLNIQATYLSFNLIVCNLVQLLTTCFRSKLMIMACSFKIVLKNNSMPHHTACILSRNKVPEIIESGGLCKLQTYFRISL